MDKAGKAYWDKSWSSSDVITAVDPNSKKLTNYVNRQFHEYFVSIFSNLDTKKMNLLEIGCAKSAWLPYFSKQFGFLVSGIDYSEIGCDQSVDILKRENVVGEIICSDFFNPPSRTLNKFDVVVSFGVAEHFTSLLECILAFSKFLKPNGIMITIIPNMTGLIGLFQKILNKEVYKIHNILDSDTIENTHKDAGLSIVLCNYYISTNFGVVNLNGLKKNLLWYFKKILLGVLTRISMIVWLIEIKFGPIKTSPFFSPYIICFSEKSQDS